ncbi:hypothetical protein H6F88_00145 [Oculatella sp. FACHB-28]|nr:hypothetical protein [Oculatella sp. FACHB-28]
MISGKKCRHLNKAGVDIGGQEHTTGFVYLTTGWFLRHNRIIQLASSMIQKIALREQLIEAPIPLL